MSLYDDASLIFIPAGAGGNSNTAHTIKPVEKLKSEEVSDNGFHDSSEWTVAFGATVGNGSAVFNSSNAGSNTDFQRVSQSNVFTDGREYVVSASVVIREGKIKFQVSGANEAIGVADTTGKYSFYYTAGDGHTFSNVLEFGRKDSGVDWDFEVLSVSVKEVEQRAIDFEIDRGSDETATRVGPDGLIEKHTHNLIKGTEDLNNPTYWYVPGNWSKDGVDQGPTYTKPLPEGEVVGYNGSKEGVFTLDKTVDHNNYIMSTKPNNTVTTTADEVWTYSVYAKAANEVSELLIGIWDSNDDNDPNWSQTGHANRIFTLRGESESGNAGSTDTNPKSAPRYYMEKIGNDGWYRCSITNVSQIEARQVRLQPREPYSIDGVTHLSAGKVYVMHPQFEKGTHATPYVKSGKLNGKGGVLEDSPRFDYLGGGCPGLLLESSTQNLISQTEWFYSWTTNETAVVIPNVVISPDGGNNAHRLDYGSTTDLSSHIKTTATITGSNDYVFSVFAKKNNATHVSLRNYDSNKDSVATFNLDSGVATSNANVINAYTEDYGNGWLRCVMAFTSHSGDTEADLRIGGYTTASGSGSKVWLYGAQLEQKHKYASSYIPNSSGTGIVTRNRDYVNDIANRFGRDNIFDGQVVTVFFQGKNIRKTGNSRFWAIHDADGKEDPRLLLYTANGNPGYTLSLQARPSSDHGRETRIDGGYLNYGDTFKAVARFNNNIVTLFVNGTQYDDGDTDSVNYDFAQWDSATVEPYDRFELTHYNGDNGHKIESLIVFPTALTDDECKDLTST